MHSKDEISLVDILKTLWQKWLVLLIVLLAGLIVGGSIGAIKNANKDYYGTTIVFYVNPTKESSSSNLPVYGSYGDNVTDTMVVLLESEYFADQLLQGMENAPEEIVDGELNPEYEELLRKIQESTTFTNYNTENTLSAQPNNVFYTKISVLNDKEFAEELLARIQSETVAFIEENMPIPSGYNKTRCLPITKINKIEQTNAGKTLSDMIKYGVLVGAATFLVGCVAIIVIDRSKKRATYAD